MMPVKWKLFRLMSFLHMICTAAVAVTVIVSLTNARINFRRWDDVLLLFLTLLMPAILLANSSINILLLERYYPERLPDKKLRRFSRVLFGLSVVVIILAVIGAVASISALVDAQRYRGSRDVIALLFSGIVTTIAVTGCYILYFQLHLRKTIARNHAAALENFLADEGL